jgi:hypothetical protein
MNSNWKDGDGPQDSFSTPIVRGLGSRVDWIQLAQDRVPEAASYEHGNGTSEFRKRWRFFD